VYLGVTARTERDHQPQDRLARHAMVDTAELEKVNNVTATAKIAAADDRLRFFMGTDFLSKEKLGSFFCRGLL